MTVIVKNHNQDSRSLVLYHFATDLCKTMNSNVIAGTVNRDMYNLFDFVIRIDNL